MRISRAASKNIWSINPQTTGIGRYCFHNARMVNSQFKAENFNGRGTPPIKIQYYSASICLHRKTYTIILTKPYIENLDRKYLKICSYGIVSALIIFICGLIILKSSPFFLNLWTIITAVLKPLILGLLLCYLVTPVTDYIESRLKFKSGTSRIIAVIITIAIALLIFAGIILLLYFILSVLKI